MDSKRNARIGLVLALVLLPVAAGVGWWSGRASQLQAEATPAPVPGRAETVPGTSAASTATPSVQPTATARGSSGPLPPLDTPLREALPELRRRADAGEAGAACRLAAEMDQCDSVRQRLEQTANVLTYSANAAERGPAPSPEAEARRRAMREAMVKRSEQLLQESTHCEGVPAFAAGERVRYWRSAALGGSVPAMRHYAIGSPFRREDMLSNLEALRVYRQEAEKIALRAVEAGDFAVTMTLAGAYSPARRSEGGSLLNQVVQPDAAKAWALLEQAQSLMGQAPGQAPSERQRMRFERQFRELEAGMDNATLAHARNLSAQYRQAAPVAFGVNRPRTPGAPTPTSATDAARRECTPP
nr:hypothetical protein [uncultured Pseudoxanthomonas sp.]